MHKGLAVSVRPHVLSVSSKGHVSRGVTLSRLFAWSWVRITSFAVMLVAVSACASSSQGGSSATPPPVSWVDQSVTFFAGGLTIYATYRHPTARTYEVPAAVLIAGSGPTDRNGNSPLISGSVDTLKTIADWLSQDGVASLRYDKLASGRTGLGPYAADPARIGIAPFEQEAIAALRFLTRQTGIDRSRLAVIGHSEGGLFALLVASGVAGPAPEVHAVGLLEPLSLRYLDLLSEQIRGQVSAALKAGQITAAEANSIDTSLASAIKSLRTTGTVPSNLPDGLGNVLNASTALFLSQADRYDPAQLASRLRSRFPVLVTCSDADIEITCGEVDHLLAGASKAQADTDIVYLRGVNHVLKQDPSRSSANYGAPLPFSSQLRTALRTFVYKNL
jgi:uncharacterized protein